MISLRSHLLSLIACALPLLACVDYERATLADSSRFELLYERDLAGFEQRLAAENQTGRADAWTRVGEAWVALASCADIDEAAFADMPEADPVAVLLHTSLRLEQARRKRLIHHRGTYFSAVSLKGTLFLQLDDEDFFVRSPSALPDDVVRWPASDEAWEDELPGGQQQPNGCKEMYDKLFEQARVERLAHDEREALVAPKRRLKDINLLEVLPARTRLHITPQQYAQPELIPPNTLAAREHQELRMAQLLAAQHEALAAPFARLPSVEALAWNATFHAANQMGRFIAALMASPRPTPTERDMVQRWNALRLELHGQLAQKDLDGRPGPSAVPGTMRSQSLLFYADGMSAAQELERARQAFERAFELGVDQRNYWLMRYGYLRTLTRMQRWEGAVALAEDLPPATSPVYGAYVWRVGQAFLKTGQTDRFMGHALQSFRDRPYQSDPFTRALYINMLTQLTSYPFDERTVELLEDMGQRSKTFERVEEYAAVSLDRGQAANAAAAARWLLAKHLNANYHPRYWAVLALAAFLEDDLAAFSAYLQEVVRRPESLREAIGSSRRATFFAGADAQLARVLREMLPVMAEWGEGAQADALREKWLSVIISTSQDFMRRTPESLARPALTELYRIASALLDASKARAYPERVGQLEPGPLVLGTVRVSERDLDPYEPNVYVRTPQLFSLTLIPRDLVPLSSWEPWWTPLPIPSLLKPMVPRKKPAPQKTESSP